MRLPMQSKCKVSHQKRLQNVTQRDRLRNSARRASEVQNVAMWYNRCILLLHQRLVFAWNWLHVIDAHFGWDETNNAADSRREWLIAIVDSRRFPAACNAIAINASASNDPISHYKTNTLFACPFLLDQLDAVFNLHKTGYN